MRSCLKFIFAFDALTLLCMFAGALVLSGCSAQSPNQAVPPELEQTAKCMFESLKTVPGVTEPRLGNASGGGWTHPFLEYRAAEKSRWDTPTRFDAQKPDHEHYWFNAMLPGMGEIDIHVTQAVVDKWKLQCGVDAYILLE